MTGATERKGSVERVRGTYVEWRDGRIAVAVAEVEAMVVVGFGLTGKVGGRVRSTERAIGGIFGNDGLR